MSLSQRLPRSIQTAAAVTARSSALSVYVEEYRRALRAAALAERLSHDLAKAARLLKDA